MALCPELLFKVSCLLLVGSMLLPFEFWSGSTLVFVNPGPSWEWDIQFTHQAYNTQEFGWSFMGVTVTTPAGSANPALDPDYAGTRWSFLSDHWGWRGPFPFQNIRELVFVLQVAAILLALLAWKKPTSQWLPVPLLLMTFTITALYFRHSYPSYSTFSFGFWLSLVACVFIFIPIAGSAKIL